MQGEIGSAAAIVGLNEAGFESGNDTITEGRDLPWLQDTAETDVWAAWAIEYRDVVVLDEDNRLLTVVNLTEEDLAEDDAYDALKAWLVP